MHPQINIHQKINDLYLINAKISLNTYFEISLKFGDIEKMSLEDLPLPLKVARGSSYALWSLAKSTKNKSWIKRSGGLSLLSRLVRSKHTGIVIPAIGTLQVSIYQQGGYICDKSKEQ